MLNIVCVQAGNFEGRGAEYVNVLFDMVARNLAEGFPGRFVCFTDDPTGLAPLADHIVARPLGPVPASARKWFHKLYLFSEGLFDPGDRILFLDLDTLITGRMDEIAAYQGDFAILQDFYRNGGLQSSVMLWRAGFGEHIWQSWLDAGCPEVSGGDQVWIERQQKDTDILQVLFPGLFVSYKATRGETPSKAAVVVFHGEPRPHQIVEGWVPQVWKLGGISRLDLDVICNTENALVLGNIESACQRDLEWFDFAPAHDRHVCIIGGSPSLAESLDSIRVMQSFGHEIWALNGTHNWLLEHGITPTACVILDARQENAAFVSTPVAGVTYYVASQCDPALFNALAGQRVVVFHNATQGAYELLDRIATKTAHLFGGGTTVGIRAMSLAQHLGFKFFHLYGMDSSYRDGQHHAYGQPLNANERVLEVLCGDRKFQCAPWMATQAEDFKHIVGDLARDDCIITVAGDGLIPHLARMIQENGVGVTGESIRAAEILSRLNGADKVRGAEIGVFAAELSRLLLERPGLNLIMVDAWGQYEHKERLKDVMDFHAGLLDEQQEMYLTLARNRTEFAADRRTILRADSVKAAAHVADQSLDFVFIDADHSYEGCRDDIAAWLPKVKPGGLMSGHDYDNHNYPRFGVTRAVNEFVSEHRLSLDLGQHYTWFARLPQHGDNL